MPTQDTKVSSETNKKMHAMCTTGIYERRTSMISEGGELARDRILGGFPYERRSQGDPLWKGGAGCAESLPTMAFRSAIARVTTVVNSPFDGISSVRALRTEGMVCWRAG